jgi:hypothetical protein
MEKTVQELHLLMKEILQHTAAANDEEGAEVVVQNFIKRVAGLRGILYEQLARLEKATGKAEGLRAVESKNVKELLDQFQISSS